MGLIDKSLSNTSAGRFIHHRNLYLLGIGLVLCGLSWSNALMSIGQFVLLGNWLLEMDFRSKYRKLLSQKTALVILTFFLFHFIGLFWTVDWDYALKDIRIKLPVLVITLVIASSKRLSIKELYFLFNIFILSVIIITLVSYSKFWGLTAESVSDKRELSIYISHIRYGLIIAFTSICSFYFFQKIHSYKWWHMLVGIYLLFTLVLFELYTGLITFICLIAFYLLRNIFQKKSNLLKIISISVLTLLTLAPTTLIYNVYKDFYQIPDNFNYDQYYLEKYTVSGNKYYHDTISPHKENAYYIWRYIAYTEIENEWNLKSQLSYDGEDAQGQALKITLLRYLSSKGLKKDSVGMSKLDNNDIKAIEHGIANVYYLEHNKFQNRIFSTLYELHNYKKYRIADGFSLAMRIEYWKIGIKIIKNNLLFGVGTGDISNAFHKMYQNGESNLMDKENWRRTHNQYLSTWIQLGIPGLILLLYMLFYPLSFKVHRKNSLYVFFLILISISMLTEDTLETQAGATLFSIFNALLLFNPKP